MRGYQGYTAPGPGCVAGAREACGVNEVGVNVKFGWTNLGPALALDSLDWHQLLSTMWCLEFLQSVYKFN